MVSGGGNRSRGAVVNAHEVTGPAASGAVWGQAGAGRSWGTARPAMRAVQAPATEAKRSGPCILQVAATVSMAPAMRAPPPCRNSPCATGRQAGWLARPHWPVRWRLSTIWGQVQCATPWGSAPVSPRITRPPRLGDGTETVAWGPPDTRSHQVRLPWGGGFPGSLHAGGPRRAGMPGSVSRTTYSQGGADGVR